MPDETVGETMDRLRRLTGVSLARLAGECQVSVPWMRSILRSGDLVPSWVVLKLLRLVVQELRRQAVVMREELQGVGDTIEYLGELTHQLQQYVQCAGEVPARIERLVDESERMLAAAEEKQHENGANQRPRRGRPRKLASDAASEQCRGRPAGTGHAGSE
jgi:hypothetical protein